MDVISIYGYMHVKMRINYKQKIQEKNNRNDRKCKY